jgi:hypothetical protein
LVYSTQVAVKGYLTVRFACTVGESRMRMSFVGGLEYTRGLHALDGGAYA